MIISFHFYHFLHPKANSVPYFFLPLQKIKLSVER